VIRQKVEEEGAPVPRWLTPEAARDLSGLRLVLSVGVHRPWGEAAKALFHVKGIPCRYVIQSPAEPNVVLREWTGEINAPQAIYDAEPVRTGYAEILFLAERLSATPALIPEDPTDRVLMFGLLRELAGEQGFGWSRRLMLFAPVMALPEDHPGRTMLAGMASRYAYSEAAASAAPARAAEILTLLADQLRGQRAAGHTYLVGDRLSALDLYWAAFAALVEPLPAEQCTMPAHLRAGYGAPHPAIEAALDRALLDHRDRIYAEYLELPIDLGP
jgi:glutathione S-transferase